ncbi:MAG: putative Ig domain-containing protein [Myxococcales bacterium]|nr:putative Ig domain-containing protein [Myxococcales bacterium]
MRPVRLTLSLMTSLSLAPLVAVATVAACGGDDTGGSGATASESDSGSSGASDSDSEATTAGPNATDVSGTASDSDISGSGSDSGTSDTDAVTPLKVDCLIPEKGTVAVPYSHVPEASGGSSPYQWSATGLPPGLEIHPNSGQIQGVPELAGIYPIQLTVVDAADEQQVKQCQIEIGDPFGVDLDALAPCVKKGDSLLNYITGGNGDPIKCTVLAGTGDGHLPDGLAVDPDTCEIKGTIAQTEYGTWAWVVQGKQGNQVVHAPYCASQLLQSPMAYEIKGTHSGGDHLDPATASFAGGQELLFDGDKDPVFTVDGSCGGPCYYKMKAIYTPTPLGKGACANDADGCFGLCPLVPDANEPDGDKEISCSLLPGPVGFEHELWAKGDPVPQSLEERVWVTVFEIHYCMGNSPEACGDDIESIKVDGDHSNLVFSLIMFP